MNIYNKSNIAQLKNLPILEDGQIFIYVLMNSDGKIKIGKSQNVLQRIKSLSGSNTGGSHITKIAVSDKSTYVHSIETTIHIHFDKYRIEGTEWFYGEDLKYEDVCNYVDLLFHSHGFDTCNNLRKKLWEEKNNGK